VSFSFQIFGDFLDIFLLLISNLIPLFKERTLYDLNLLKFEICFVAQNMSILINVLCAFIKKQANFKQTFYHCIYMASCHVTYTHTEHAKRRNEQSGSPDVIFPQENDSLTTKDMNFCDTQKRAFMSLLTLVPS